MLHRCFAVSLCVLGLVQLNVGRVASASDHPIIPAFERFHAQQPADLAAGGRLLLRELRCGACHTRLPVSATGRVAPLLTDVGSRLRPKAIREMLLGPHAVKPGTLMPDVLGDLSKQDRAAAAEALTHFLIGNKTLHDVPPTGVARGEELFHEVGCIACHQSRRADAEPLATSVPLEFVDRKYSVTSLSAFLRNPHAVRPSGRMPNLNLTEQESREIAGYLLKDLQVPANLTYRYYEGSWQQLPSFDSLEPKSTGAATGFDVGVRERDNQFGLVFEGFLQVPRSGAYTFELSSDDGSRLIINGDVVVDNDGIHGMQTRSGKVTLEEGPVPIRVEFFEQGGGEELVVLFAGPGLDRQSVSALVTSTRVPQKVDRFEVREELAETGARVFAMQGCASCHDVKRGGMPVGKPQEAGPIQSPTAGCLAESPPANVPDYHLSAKQRLAIAAALKAGSLGQRTSEQTISQVLQTFNCYACHARGSVGGPERARDDAFVTTIPEMGDEGRIPPPLDGVGDKLNDDWLKHVMDNGANDRPYMLTRMPKFGREHVGLLVEAFAEADRRSEVADVKFDQPLHRVRAAGRYMMGDQAPLSCTKCHYFGKYAATGIQAMDLQTMTRRLRRDWFHRYLLNPQVYRPGTRMPAAWPNGKSIVPDVLDGKPATQIQAIWEYLAQGTKAPIPSGLIAGSIELKPKAEPIIYRNFITSLSPRGIAVGFPEKAHYAWDAKDMSLALIWHGAFIDAAKHWVGRGPGTQEPLGDNRFSLIRGVPIAQLADVVGQSWPDPPEALQFRGYRLNDAGQPEFSYTLGQITVRDFIEPQPGEDFAWFRRSLRVQAPGEQGTKGGWFCRVAAGRTILDAGDGRYIVDDAIEIRLPDAAVVLRELEGQSELLVPLRFVEGAAQIVQEIRW